MSNEDEEDWEEDLHLMNHNYTAVIEWDYADTRWGDAENYMAFQLAYW